MTNENATITKLSNNEFLVQYLDKYNVLNWQAIMEFYLDTLGAEEESIEQIMQNLAYKKIGENFEA